MVRHTFKRAETAIDMVEVKTFVQLVHSFEGVVEAAHSEKRSFKISQKIFATLDEEANSVVLKLSVMDQAIFCLADKHHIYPVSGGWGRKGWTVMELSGMQQELLQDALTKAYCNVAPKRLAKQYDIQG